MSIAVRKAVLWRRQVENQSGVLANTLEPLAEADVDLQVVMGFRDLSTPDKAIIEVLPISGRKATSAAERAGLSVVGVPILQVEGDNKPGMGHAIAKAVGEAGINLSFLIAQVVGRKYTALFGFETEADAKKASGLIKRAATTRNR